MSILKKKKKKNYWLVTQEQIGFWIQNLILHLFLWEEEVILESELIDEMSTTIWEGIHMENYPFLFFFFWLIIW